MDNNSNEPAKDQDTPSDTNPIIYYIQSGSIISQGIPGNLYAISSSTSVSSIIVITPMLDGASGTIVIGPGPPDEYGSARGKEVQEIWRRLPIERFIPGLFKQPLNLFREALSSYQIGNFMATCIMCRTAVDSLLYLAGNSKAKTVNGGNAIAFAPPKLNGKISPQKYKDLLKLNDNYFDESAKKWLSEELDPNDVEKGLIRHSGDLVAHYTEKIVRELDSTASVKVPIDLWITMEKALKVLTKTGIVIETINDRFRKFHSV